jgi:predicted neuraminidase
MASDRSSQFSSTRRPVPKGAEATVVPDALAPDILVVGAGMAGVMAALSAKTAMNRVLLVEPSNVLGGQGTAGGVAGFCGDSGGVNCDFDDLVARLREHNFIRKFNPTEDRRSYDLEWCAFFLQEMVLEREIDVLLHSRVTAATAVDGVITTVDVSTVGGLCTLRPKFIIDATGACLVPAMAGFPVLHEGANKQLPMSLYFTLWDSGKAGRAFLPPGCEEWTSDADIPMTTLHYFDSGKVEVKMKVVGFDAADGLSFSRAEMHARRQMISLIYYLQTKGFRGKKLDRHVLSSVSRHIGVRETRRIVGEHFLTTEEVTHGTVFDDAVAVGTYHLDYHWPDTMLRGDTGITTMVEPYHIPLRAMTPKGARNLLVPGRGASGDQMAMSSFRVMAPVSQMGFAAGKAAQICARDGCGIDAIDLQGLREMIEAGGQRLDLSSYGIYLRNSLVNHEQVFADDRPFQQCHAPTIAQLRNNRFLVAWFGGRAEGAEDVGIWMADRFQCVWSTPRLVAKVSAQPHWNPVLVRSPDGAVTLYFRVGGTCPEWRTWLMASIDEGKTWTTPVELESEGASAPGPVKHAPLRLADGTLLAGNSMEAGGDWRVCVNRSTDGGRTWVPGASVSWARPEEKDTGAGRLGDGVQHLKDTLDLSGRGVIQPALWQSAPDCIHLLARSSTGALYRSDSSDAGLSWSPLAHTELPSNNSGIAVCRLHDGALVLASNPVAENWGARTPLRLSLSVDNGQTWPHSLDIESGPGEHSYPAMVATPRGVAVVYTWKRERIAFWHGSVEQIMDRAAIEKHTEALHSGIMP